MSQSEDAQMAACIWGYHLGGTCAGRVLMSRVDSKWHLVTVEALQPLKLIAG